MNILTTLGYLLIGLLGFGLLILIHELGHFILAKINGVIVEEFSIGMGPKLCGLRSKETQYNIRILPIGGYVKMLGENEESTNPRAFTNLAPARRLSIVAAGPIMNIVLAIVLFAIIKGYIIGYSMPIVSNVINNSPAYQAGIKVNDKILSINNKYISNWDDFVSKVMSSNGKKVHIGYEHNGIKKEADIIPIMDTKQNRYLIGISPTAKKYGLFKSIALGADETKNMVKETFNFFGTLIAGKAKASQVGGPISIMRISIKAAELGIPNLIYLLAAISVQLGIFNIIPFPALDGGYIFLFLFEIITGKRVSDNKVGMINYFGFICLMGLMILVTIKDILYPIKF